MTQARLARLRLTRRGVQRSASPRWLSAMLVLLACGGTQEAPAPSRTPIDDGSAADESAGSAANGESGTTPSAGMMTSEGETETTNEGVGEDVELVANEPEEGIANGPEGSSGEPAQGTAAGEEAVPPEPGEAVPTIAPPGFPTGSPPRLVPVQFAGPITGQPVLFNVYLPPGYDSGSASYPVLYDLHGLTDSRDTNPGPVIRSFEASMRNGVVGPLIVVFPQSFAEGYYADSLDAARPGETQVIAELIPYVDQNFRTLAHRTRRGVSGFSMGGFGALAYATKHTDRFSVGIAYDSALDTWETLVGRRAYIAAAAFGNDESHFDQISPWANASLNAALLAQSSTLRIVPGAQYLAFNQAFRDHLTALGIPHEFTETDCPHDYNCLIDREGTRSWAIIQAEFSKPAASR